MRGKPRQQETEERFLARYDAGAFAHPSVAVDVVLLSAREGELWTVVLKRERHPHRGRFALPGVFVGVEESLDAAAQRALVQKAGIRHVFLEQLYTFGAPRRDP